MMAYLLVVKSQQLYLFLCTIWYSCLALLLGLVLILSIILVHKLQKGMELPKDVKLGTI